MPERRLHPNQEIDAIASSAAIPRTRAVRIPPPLASFVSAVGNGLLLLVYAAAALGQAIAIDNDLAAGHASRPTRWLELASGSATIAFLAVQFALVLIRRPALVTAPGLRPILVTAGATLAPGLLFCIPPRSDIDDGVRFASLSLLTVGMAVSAVTLGCLGRSFSLLPQARGLVVSGPYKRLRHPLYAAELVSMFGLMLEFSQPWALLVFVVATLSLVPRMDLEENVLTAAFPEYADYARRTWRVIPGVY